MPEVALQLGSLFMLFSWLRKRRRRSLLATPFRADWETCLHECVGHYTLIPAAQQLKMRDIVRLMLAEKDWEGCRGLALTDEMRVIIAASAGVLILGLDDYYFDNVQTILVYPNSFIVKQEQALAGGATMEEDQEHLGEAHHRGPIILSWAETAENALKPGYGQNLVFHEFAHQLDMLNGAFDGTPNLATNELAQRWAKIMAEEFRRLQRAERRGRRTVLDPYGAENPAEFFAVTTECFFDAPRAMLQSYPELYALFRDYYRQDPATWPAFEVPA
jgi:Mlc titration factor MtfA (ptsG expression regulator)